MKIFSKAFVVQAIAALLIFVFAYTAISKFFNFEIFEFTLTQVPVVGHYAEVMAILLSVINLLPVVLLSVPRTRQWGLFYCCSLLLCYTIYIGYSLIAEKNLPCSCSGIAPWLSWKTHLLTNIILLALSFSGLFLLKRIIAIKKLALAEAGNRVR